MAREVTPVTYYDNRNTTSYDLDQRIDLTPTQDTNPASADDGPDIPVDDPDAPVADPAAIQAASEGDAPNKGNKAASPRVPKG